MGIDNFIYFAVISMITPPVALASFVAAGMAKSDLWETGLQAFKIAIPGFLIPFVIVYNPGLILEGPLWDIIWGTFTTLIVPEIITDFIGMAMVGGILAVQLRRPSDLIKREIPIF